MSDTSRFPPRMVPLTTPERARDMARWTKALSDEYAELDVTAQANAMRRESEWWLAYALTLEETSRSPAGGSSGG
jgi:hypothetical protein